MSIVFTEPVLRAASEILEKYHRAVAVAIYGKDSLSPADWDLAVKLGLVDPKAVGAALSEQIYQFGVVAAHMDHATRQTRYGSTAADWLAEVAKHPTPLTTMETKAAAHANHRAAQFVVGLGRRAATSMHTTVLVEDAKLSNAFRSAIRDVVSARFGDDDAQQRLNKLGDDKGLGDDFFKDAYRATIKKVRSELGHATGEWTRDLERIAHTESVESFNHGEADEWQTQAQQEAEEDEKPMKPVRAYRVPSPTACSYCRRLYTTSASNGGDLRIFYLSELLANGTNFKTKRADWKPIVGATHPFCACDLQRLPTYIQMPKGWKSGEPAPTIIDPEGFAVIDGGET